jgi:hypothetical protein
MKHDDFSMIPKANVEVCDGNSQHPQTQESLHVKIMNEDNAHCFFDIKGIVHFEFIPQGQTVDQAYYVEIMKLGLGKGLNFGPTFGFSTMTIYQLTRCSVKQFLAQKLITEKEHPPCSPN